MCVMLFFLFFILECHFSPRKFSRGQPFGKICKQKNKGVPLLFLAPGATNPNTPLVFDCLFVLLLLLLSNHCKELLIITLVQNKYFGLTDTSS